MGIKTKILNNPSLKKRVYRLIMPQNDYRPRLWFRLFVIPFICKKGAGAVIRRSVRLDLLPNHDCMIGKKTIVEDFSIINNTVGKVLIGNNSIIGLSNVIIGPVTVGNNVLFAQHVVLSGLNHNYQDVSKAPVEQGITTREIIIEDNVWIGANTTITAGVSIGKHSVIGAGSVITKNVPPYSVVAGNPGKILKQYNIEQNTWAKYTEALNAGAFKF